VPKLDDFLYIVDACNLPNNNIIVTMPNKKQVAIKVKSPVEKPIVTTAVDSLFSEINSLKLENKKRPAPITSAPTTTKSVSYHNTHMFQQLNNTNIPKVQVKQIAQSTAPVEQFAPQANVHATYMSNLHKFRTEEQSVTLTPTLILLDNSNSFESFYPDSVSPLNNSVPDPVNSFSSRYAADALYHINKKRKVAAESSGYDNYPQASYYYNNQPFVNLATCIPSHVNERY